MGWNIFGIVYSFLISVLGGKHPTSSLGEVCVCVCVSLCFIKPICTCMKSIISQHIHTARNFLLSFPCLYSILHACASCEKLCLFAKRHGFWLHGFVVDFVLIAVVASVLDLKCKRGSVGQSERLFIRRSSVLFRLNPKNSNSHGFEVYRPSIKGTKLLYRVHRASSKATRLFLTK